MKYYTPYRNKKSYQSPIRNSLEIKPETAKKCDSTYFQISLTRQRNANDTLNKRLSQYGVISLKKPVFDNYIIEFDKHDNGPHFHVWRASDNNFRISDTRSRGISLKSGIHNGIVYTEQEKNSYKLLNDRQEEQFISFVEENRKLLLAMFCAFKAGKVKSFVGLDEELVYSLFDKNELNLINRQFKKLERERVSEKV
jgi:hypothetical protein